MTRKEPFNSPVMTLHNHLLVRPLLIVRFGGGKMITTDVFANSAIMQSKYLGRRVDLD